MILLDTNVVSELRQRRGGPDPRVAHWIGRQTEGTLFLSAATILELERGVLLMERRDRRQGQALRRWLKDGIFPAFEGRVLPMDIPVALTCAALHVPDRRPEMDAIIAATALVRNFSLATRNIADFAGTGVRLVDPWQA